MTRFKMQFWLLNLMQMLEKLAYWTMLMQLPVYIAQKDAPGGLAWGQTTKGILFFWWAIVQNIAPIFAGGFADRIGRRKMLLISFITILSSYVILAFSHDFATFLFGLLMLGLGSGLFKPTLQGQIALNIGDGKVGWGVYFMLLNVAVMLCAPLSNTLQKISYEMVFFGSTAVFAMNFIVLLFLKEDKNLNDTANSQGSVINVFKDTFIDLFKSKVFSVILFMSGFYLVYIQFYETIANFYIDWVDTSMITQSLDLPKWFQSSISGTQSLSFEWVYFFNSILIICCIVTITWLFSKIRRSASLGIGIALASAGLMTIGASRNGWLVFLGIAVYTFGEMIVNPKFSELLATIAPQNKKSQFMGYLNISLAIGFGIGSLSGGWIYEHYGEKASLAIRHLEQHYPDLVNIESTAAFDTLKQATELDSNSLTDLLWHEYKPYSLWFFYLFIGLFSAAAVFNYSRRFG